MSCETQRLWMCEVVLPALPGATKEHLYRTFWRKLQEFLQESSCWIDEDTFTADQFGNVRLNPVFEKIQAQISWIHEVWHEDRRLSHVTLVPPAFRARIANPVVYTNTPYPDVIKVWPKPGTENEVNLVVRGALTVSQCFDDPPICVPDWVWDRYKEALREGVLGELLQEPSKPYTNIPLGEKHESKYYWWITKARDEARRGFGHHESEWVYPRGFYV
jgi:hypothetical protein